MRVQKKKACKGMVIFAVACHSAAQANRYYPNKPKIRKSSVGEAIHISRQSVE